MSLTTSCRPWSDPAAASLHMRATEHADPGGVNCTTLKSAPARWSTSRRHPARSAWNALARSMSATGRTTSSSLKSIAEGARSVVVGRGVSLVAAQPRGDLARQLVDPARRAVDHADEPLAVVRHRGIELGGGWRLVARRT